jgi:hypothetical protein
MSASNSWEAFLLYLEWYRNYRRMFGIAPIRGASERFASHPEYIQRELVGVLREVRSGSEYDPENPARANIRAYGKNYSSE